jgi:hypothetical protein
LFPITMSGTFPHTLLLMACLLKHTQRLLMCKIKINKPIGSRFNP